MDYLLGRTPDVFVDETDRDTLNIMLLKINITLQNCKIIECYISKK